METLVILGIVAFVVGLSSSYFFFNRARKMAIYDHFSVIDYALIKRTLSFLFFVAAIYEFVSSIYIVQCSGMIEVFLEEPKNFFVLGLLVGSLLVKDLKR